MFCLCFVFVPALNVTYLEEYWGTHARARRNSGYTSQHCVCIAFAMITTRFCSCGLSVVKLELEAEWICIYTVFVCSDMTQWSNFNGQFNGQMILLNKGASRCSTHLSLCLGWPIVCAKLAGASSLAQTILWVDDSFNFQDLFITRLLLKEMRLAERAACGGFLSFAVF